MTHEEIIEHSKNLVAMRSVAANQPGLHQAVNYIAAILAEHPDITVERFESNGVPSLLAYYGQQRPERFETLFNGHLDVVPAQDDSQYTPLIKEGRFYGRGVYDMKMACVAMTDAFIRYGQNHGRAFGLQIVADEEVGGYDGVCAQLDQGVAADFTIMGEMTDLGICNEARGLCWVEVNFKGTSAHGGYAWNGDNAIAKASDFTNALLARFPVPKEQQWCTTANIAAITTGNETFNIVPNDATVKVDFRFTSEDANFKDAESVKALITQIAPEAVVVDMPVFEPAVTTPESNIYLRHFMRSFESVSGDSVTLIRRYAGSDGRHFAMRGMDTIEFGLSGADHHSESEYVDLSSLQPFCDTLRAYMRSPVPTKPSSTRAHVKQVVTAA
ncbi:MAG TPA: M20/M25/M40 family metallo-hydrolase [Candidatus Saccharimonadales bacterium]|nr:M20/M25/M40 family metallo-hydrolase [Candidatus Saccharimonadales bacterium]